MKDIKRQLKKKYLFYKKMQLVFFVIIYLCVHLLVFFSFVTLFRLLLFLIILLCIIFGAGIMYNEAKYNRQVIEDYFLYYTLLKAKNEKKEKQRKI